jgi:hypothetical protein
LLDKTLGNFQLSQFNEKVFDLIVSPEPEVSVEQKNVADGKWHHIKIVGNNKQLTVQLDDSKIQKWESSNGYSCKPSIITLGRATYSEDAGYTGRLKNIYMGKIELLGLVKNIEKEKRYTMD